MDTLNFFLAHSGEVESGMGGTGTLLPLLLIVAAAVIAGIIALRLIATSHRAHHVLAGEILRLGVISAFFAHAMLAFLAPQSIVQVLEYSSLTHPLYDAFPSLIILIGINDLLLSLMIAMGKFATITASWAAVWIVGVGVVILSSAQGLGIGTLVDILGHGAPLAIAIFLAITPRITR